MPWVRVGERVESRESPGDFKDLKDLFANLTTWGRLEDSLCIRVIAFPLSPKSELQRTRCNKLGWIFPQLVETT